MTRALPLLLFLLQVTWGLHAQQWPSRISTRWSDSFVEWDILAPVEADVEDSTAVEELDEETIGSLELRKLHLEDWSEWRYNALDQSGTIKLKWKEDPTQWELRNGLDIVSMKATWVNDFTEWRITDNSITLTLRSKYTSQLDEWFIKSENYGNYHIYTRRERDPRDWYIDDELVPEIPLCMRIAVLFTAVYHGSPRI